MTIILAVSLVLSVLIYIESRRATYKIRLLTKENNDLYQKIEVMEKAEKVIKDCVLYSEMPINVKGNNIAFIDCQFKGLDKKPATEDMRNICGLEA